jgi:hypothetical protein
MERPEILPRFTLAVYHPPVDQSSPRQERTMSEQKHVRIELTEEQKAQVKAATGKDARALELNVEELEQRIAPGKVPLKP